MSIKDIDKEIYKLQQARHCFYSDDVKAHTMMVEALLVGVKSVVEELGNINGELEKIVKEFKVRGNF